MKIGILGGTFDPPHMGHLHMAELALKSKEVDFIWWVPTLIYHTHKHPEDWVDRYYMCHEMVKFRENMSVSDIELNANDAQMTEDVLKRLVKWNGKHSFRYILGADIYWEREKWSNFPLIAELAPPLWVNRPGAKELPVRFLKGNMDISSSQVRKILEKKDKTQDDFYFLMNVLHPSVLSYILSKRLYNGETL